MDQNYYQNSAYGTGYPYDPMAGTNDYHSQYSAYQS